MAVADPFVLAVLGTSLSTGRLAADWPVRLQEILRQQPEAIGPVIVYNMGKGSQTSDWGVTRAPDISVLRPSHVLMEGFGINDSVDFGGGPAVTRANHITNLQTIIAELRSKRADVDITIQTMSPVSAAGAASRPALADYYADELAVAALQSTRSLDNYAVWPKPMAVEITNLGDGLHPLWNTPAPSVYMTGPAAPAGELAAGSSEFDTTYQAWMSFDGASSTNYWRSQTSGLPQYLRRQWTAPQTFTSYAIRGIAPPDTNRNPISWTVRGSNDGSVWDTLDTRTNVEFWTGDQELRRYSITFPGAYTYYETNITTTQGSASAALGELTYFSDAVLGAVDTYLFPTVLAWARARMAAYWA